MHCKEQSVSGFFAPGSPRVSGVLLPLSPTRGRLRRPDKSATRSQSPALQATTILVLDTFPSHPIPHPTPTREKTGKSKCSAIAQIAACRETSCTHVPSNISPRFSQTGHP